MYMSRGYSSLTQTSRQKNVYMTCIVFPRLFRMYTRHALCSQGCSISRMVSLSLSKHSHHFSQCIIRSHHLYTCHHVRHACFKTWCISNMMHIGLRLCGSYIYLKASRSYITVFWKHGPYRVYQSHRGALFTWEHV